MTRSERCALEAMLVEVFFDKFMANPVFGGTYVSATPGAHMRITHAHTRT